MQVCMRLARGKSRGNIQRRPMDILIEQAHTLKAVARQVWLSAARAGELAALQWPDVDIAAYVMALPLTKNGSARAVPLVPAIVALLEAMKPKTPTPLVGPVLVLPVMR